jgi:hypothetical protein
MSNINILLNYYIQNDYLNLTNNIIYEDLVLLISYIDKLQIKINNINVPKNFKYIDLIKEKFIDIKLNIRDL